MFRILVVILLLQCALSACAPDPAPTAPSASEAPAAPKPLEPTQALPSTPAHPVPISDPELEDFLRRAEFLIQRFVQVAPTVEAVAAAVEAGDEAFLTLLDLDREEFREIRRRLQREARRLLSRDPRLQSEVDALLHRGAPPCETWELMDLARRLRQHKPRDAEAEKNRFVECREFPYVAALVLCASSGNPIVYVACAVVAMCNFCSGGIVDSICGA